MKLLRIPVFMVLCGTLFSFGVQAQSRNDSLKAKPADTSHKAPIQLKEVLIKAAPVPVKMRGDTVSYNAKAFKTRVNSTVEDLIKKLPGLQVDEHGRVIFQGKSIEKIYIDGKDYYLNDPKLITQSLTADMIERIEVFDQQSEHSRLTGVKDINPGKALNLKLKKGVNLDFTGRVNAGYGSRNGYGAGAKGSSFVKERAITGALSSNNINDLTEENRLPFSNYGRSGSDKLDLRYSAPWGRKLRASLAYSGLNKRLENRRSASNRQSLLADSSQLENRDSEGTGRDHRHGLNGTWELAIDSSTNLNLQSSLGFFNGNNQSRDTLYGTIIQPGGASYAASSGSTRNTSTLDQFNTSNSARYDQRLKKRSLSFNLSQGYARNKQQGSLNSLLRLYAPDGSISRTEKTDQRFNQAYRHKEYAAGFSDAEQLEPGRSLNIGYQYQQFSDQTDKQGFNYNPQTGKYDLPDTLTTGNFSNSSPRHQASLAYVSNGKKINYSVRLSFEHSMLANSDPYRGLKFNRSFSTVLPFASFAYNYSTSRGGGGLSAEYSAGSQQPYAVQLQPVTDNQDPMELVTGNPGLKQAISHTVYLHYSSFNAKSLRNLELGLRAVYEQHSIITATEILAGGVQKVTYVNQEGKYTLSSDLNYELPIGSEHQGKLRYSMQNQYDRSPALLNGKEIVLQGVSNSQKAEIRYRVKQLELNAEGMLSYQRSRYNGGNGLNISGLIQNYKMTIGYDLPLSMLLKSDCSVQIIGAQGGLPANRISVWNFSLLKNVFKSGRGEFKLSAYDLLNSNKGFYQRIAAGYIQQTTANVLGRLFLFSFICHIRSVPSDNDRN